MGQGLPKNKTSKSAVSEAVIRGEDEELLSGCGPDFAFACFTGEEPFRFGRKVEVVLDMASENRPFCLADTARRSSRKEG